MRYANYMFTFDICISDCISHLNDDHVDTAKFTVVGNVDTLKFTVTSWPPRTSLFVRFQFCAGRRRTFTTGRRTILPFRSIDTTLTTLSLPACNLTFVAISQLVGLQCPVIRTTSLTLKILELLLNCFVRGSRFAIYYVCQRRHNVCRGF